MEKSIWEKEEKHYPCLEKNSSCDVLIVGGGITGISLAYYLKDTSQKVIVLEQNKIGHSTTMKSTAKLTYLQQDIALKIKNNVGFRAARDYVYAQINAIEEMVRIIQKENISCHLEKNDSYLFVNEEKNQKKLRKVYQLYRDFDLTPEYQEIPQFSTTLSFRVKDTYVFHPLEYIYGLLKCLEEKGNISIYEHTRMIRFRKMENGYRVFLEGGEQIDCHYFVFANHYLPFVSPYFLPLKNYLEVSSITAKPHENLAYNAINLDKDVLSIRFFENYQILLRNSKRLSNHSITEQEKEEAPFWWRNYDFMTQHGFPLIGRIQKNSNIFIASGYNTWGMTNSNIAARIIASLIEKEDNPFPYPFSSRYTPSLFSVFHFLEDNIHQFIHFIGSYLLPQGKAKIIWKKGKRYGVYVDLDNKKHVVALTCPHMKCSLRFNEQEKTWDCPCHGSKFDVDGNLIRGPATNCIKQDTTF